MTIALATPIALTKTGERLDITYSFAAASGPIISGADNTRLFDVAVGVGAKLSSLQLSFGKADNGGAIFNAGTLTVANSILSKNNSITNGGAIYNLGTLTVTQTTLSDNSAADDGGAIYNVDGTVVVRDSTIGGGNSANNGGGLANVLGTMFVINSTIYQNTALADGGGIHSGSALGTVLTNSTVVSNQAGTSGGGIQTAPGGLTVANNTIIGANQAGGAPGDLAGDALGTSKNNLVGDAATAGGLVNLTAGNLVGVDMTLVFDALETNKTTAYFPLKANSPAIDKGANALAVDDQGNKLTTDQSLLSNRVSPTDGIVDIGSAEFLVLPPFDYVPPTEFSAREDTLLQFTALDVQIAANVPTPTTVVLTVNDGTLKFTGTATGVSNLVGDGTAKLSFSADNGALLGGFSNVLSFTPSKDAFYDSKAGKTFTVSLTNGTASKSYVVPLVTTPVADTPVGISPATLIDTVRTVTLSRNPVDGGEIAAFKITNITNGKLFADEKLTIPVSNDDFVPVFVDANNVPATFVVFYFQPNAGFVGTMSFAAQASTTKDATGLGGAVFTSPVTVSAASTPTASVTSQFGIDVGSPSLGLTKYDLVVRYNDDTALDVSKIGKGDVTITGPNGFTQGLDLVSVNATTNGTPRYAIYRLTPPGGSWDAADNGRYVVSVAGNEVFDTAGNAVAAQTLQAFEVDVTAGVVAGAPTAKLTAADVGQTALGATAYTFTVTYTAVAGGAVDAATLGSKNVLVFGANGFENGVLAEFVSATPAGNGSPLTATYKLTPPGGSWDSKDSGTYGLFIDSNQVKAVGGVPVSAEALGQFSVSLTDAPAVPPATLVGTQQFGIGPDATGNGSVQFLNPDKSVRFTVTPFPGFTGGVRTAAGDFNGDGVADLVVGTGPGTEATVRVLDGVSQAQLFTLQPFPGFVGGVFVATGDLNADGKADLVISPDEGGGPRVRVFSGNGFVQLADFFGIDDTAFRGGARATFGDLNGDGKSDLIVAAGFGGGPRVAAFNGAALTSTGGPKLFGDFFLFEPGLRNGAYVTAGDLDGDGFAELIGGAGPGGGPRIYAVSGRDLVLNNQQVQKANFFGGDVANRGGVRVTVKNLDGDNRADLVIGAGTGAGSKVTAYAGKAIPVDGTPATLFSFDAVPGFTNGVFVG
jgi:hypothetical protein